MSSKVKKIFIGSSTILLVVLLPYLNQTCTESPNSPDNETFSFKVKAVDIFNKPIPNLNVGVYFHLEGTSNKNILKVQKDIDYGNTKFIFSLEQMCNVELAINDLDGNIMEKLISIDKQPPGIYEVLYITGDLFPGVYNCVLTAEDTLENEILFQDSVYAVLYHTDPAYNSIGFTNTDGTFFTNKKVIFPSLYTLPTLVETGIEGPEQIGAFSIGDSITILLTDTLANQTFNYTRKLTQFSNEFILLFPPDADVLPKSNTYHYVLNDYLYDMKDIRNNMGEWINSVDLEYFQYEVNEDTITLRWKTNSELNNQGFEIQRYYHHSEFYAIGFVNGMGTTNEPHTYSFIDRNLAVGDYKYRLKILAIDGTFDYSDTLNVSILMLYEFSLFQNYPNPFN